MWDMFSIAASIVFFAISISYTLACERLGRRKEGSR